MQGKMKSALGLMLAMLCFAGAACAANGFIFVSSVPDGASIEINGKPVGKAPYTGTLAPGTCTVKATLTSYAPSTATVTVKEGEVARVDLALRKDSIGWEKWQEFRTQRGAVSILTDVPGAEIYIDSVKRPETTPATLKNLAAGDHTLVLISQGFAISRSFPVKQGTTTIVSEHFAPLQQQKTPAVSAEELKKKREALPAKLVVRCQKPATQTSGSQIWGANDTATLQFKYKKQAATEWGIKELAFDNTEAAMDIEKGTYDIVATGTRYREATGLITIIVESKKQKIAETSSSFARTFAADTQYTVVFAYDNAGNLTYNFEEKTLNTAIQ
jgi:hypothetical protein